MNMHAYDPNAITQPGYLPQNPSLKQRGALANSGMSHTQVITP
jgi:hypothetical protein